MMSIQWTDIWENQEAIDKHHVSPMMHTIMELREKYDLHMKVERYVSDEMPKSDECFVIYGDYCIKLSNCCSVQSRNSATVESPSLTVFLRALASFLKLS